jgi:hypothetical protein
MAQSDLISGLLNLISQQAESGSMQVRNWWSGGGTGGDDPPPDTGTGPTGDPYVDPGTVDTDENIILPDLPPDESYLGDDYEYQIDENLYPVEEDVQEMLEDDEVLVDIDTPPEIVIEDEIEDEEYFYYQYDGYDEDNQLQAAYDHQDDMLQSLYQQFVDEGSADWVVTGENLYDADGHVITDQNMTQEEAQAILAQTGSEFATGDVYYSTQYGRWMQKVEDRSRIVGEYVYGQGRVLSDHVKQTLRDYKKAQFMHNWEAGMVGGYGMFAGGHTADLTQMDWSAYDSGEYGYDSGGFYDFLISGEHGMGYNAAGEAYDGWNWTDYYNFQVHGTQTNYSGNAGSGYWNDPNSSYGTYYAFDDGMTGYMQSWNNSAEGAGFNNDPNTPGGYGISWYDSDGNYRGEFSSDEAPTAWSRDEDWVYTPFQFEYNGVVHG